MDYPRIIFDFVISHVLIALEYINYLLQSKKRHGVHSPFIYELTDKCFAHSISREDSIKLIEYDHINSISDKTIVITDHGAGSKRMSNTRRVKRIYKNSSSRGKYGRLLYKLSAYYEPARILELGTSLGTGTARMSLGNPNAIITTVEGCPATAEIARSNFELADLKNVQLIYTTFDDFIQSLTEEDKFDLIFIDGHHDGKALLRYLDNLKPFIHNDSILILDDIRWSKSMFEAWLQIKNMKDFHVTIDLFRMGMIIPRLQQEKEHFVIRT